MSQICGGTTDIASFLLVAGSKPILLFLFTSSCGACKQFLKRLEQMCVQAHHQQAGVVFVKHNIYNEFDDFSDLSRMYKVRYVPCFMFFDEGALVRKMVIRDVRQMAFEVGSAQGVQQEHNDDYSKLQTLIRALVFKAAPSSRP